MPRLKTIPGIFVTLLLIGTVCAQSEPWKRNAFATERFEINGTGGRNNPLRKKLPKAFTGDELFVRYRVQYDKASIDSPPASSGEFFVLWLDQHEGNDGSTHSGGVPNIGIHVANNQNKFMIRYSPGGESFSRQLEGDREFLVVARLWKSIPGKESSFDQLDLWVDPTESTEFKPDTSVHSGKAINTVNWIGFSTGGKTELEDRISVWDIDWANTWRDILELPPEIEPTPAAPKITKMERTVDFDKHVVPILENKCFKCHQGEKAKKDIRLDIHDEVLNLTSPGDSGSSQLFQMVSNHEMPPEDEEPLSDAELEVLQKWIDEGLVWNESLFPPPVPKTDHWAFQPVRKPDIPEVKNTAWLRTPVDAFIARKQEEAGTSPAPEATPEILARRLSLDLLGLPPSGESASVGELLENPAYGERWGRHWLDVSRWAESNGHQHNRDRPYSWRYRDWVVEAFNNDMPYDRFVLAQIAGDEIESADPDNIVATGFLAAARYSGNEMDKEIQRNDILVDIVNATGSAFLGLTMECAQCHTHKFDPISIRDYYRMKAFFEKGQPHNISLSTNNEAAGALVEERWSIFDQTYNRMVLTRRKKGIPNPALVIPKSVVKSIAASEKKRYTELENEIADLNQTWAFYSPVTAGIPRVVTPHEMRWPLPRDPATLENRSTTILLRGDVKAPGPEVKPGWPLVFGETGDVGNRPRTALANWLTEPTNPLTARVWVNRIWQWHFGTGLVKTSGDFGAQGTPPSHPELLDFLATELMENNWSTRHIHRLILESATYRQSCRFSAENDSLDPENLTYWRREPRRLESEAIRDSMLSAAGLLSLSRGGPSDPLDKESLRRSLYLKQRRDNFPDQQILFDTANGISSCARRRVSTNSLQPLWLMNSPLSQKSAAALANRAGSVEAAFALALGRPPDSGEKKLLQKQADQHGLASACLAILNSSEFLYIP